MQSPRKFDDPLTDDAAGRLASNDNVPRCPCRGSIRCVKRRAPVEYSKASLREERRERESSARRVKPILPALTEATSPYWRRIKYSLFE